MEKRKRVSLAPVLRDYLRADSNKSKLCLALGISRPTLARWTARRPEELSRMDRAEAISRITDIEVRDLFELEEQEATA